ncbi:multiple sugar transport system substrate-binding protein [Deinobacterium chartae]|uniref:Multiple sugar transport system substrate-binding protein n=1 Tax=Deinobacterium chartae TaxID=521158 RepID=A0A841HWD1_9DEIO|nr:extracellular solute-binding protein [Deinobacterium chartae]MBB6097226.1 multiple sugar transport system substrate-binding protein [Deinobacterium chartae]
MKRTALLGATLVLLTGSALAQKNVTIKINGPGGDVDPVIVNDLINRFVKPAVAKDGINVVYEPFQDYNPQLTIALSSGNAGDLFYLQGEQAQGFIATGRILPLNGLVDTKPFVDNLVRAFTVSGKVYGIAKDFNTLTLTYNKDIFDEAKVPYPTNNETWDSLADKLRRVKKALGDGYYGACLSADFARMGAIAYANGWKQFDANGKTNLLDPKFVSAFKWYTDLVREKVAVQPSDISAGWPGECFKNGKTAIALEGGWLNSYLKDQAPNLQYGTALLPKSKATGKRGNFLYTVAWAVNARTKNKDAALKVLKALTSPQAQQYVLESGLAIPSRKALTNNTYFKRNDQAARAAKVVFDGASNGTVNLYGFGKYGPDWAQPINAALSAVMSGQSSAEAALKKAQADLNALKR